MREILPNTVPDPASLELESDYACPEGRVVVAPDCGKEIFTTFYEHCVAITKILYIIFNMCLVPCAVGTFYDKNTRTCVPCPLGMYQSEVGQMHCYTCPSIAGKPGVTVAPGARLVEDCKGRNCYKILLIYI